MSSTAVLTEQRMKAQGNHVGNALKEDVSGHEEFDAWRTQAATHQGYGTAMSSTMSDPYMSSYYGTSYPFQTFGAMGDATWSSGADPMTFLGGYGQQMGHDSYNIDGMFGPGGFNGFSQPGFGYSFAGSGGEYAWGNSGMGSSAMGRSKHYEDYYRDSMYGHDDRAGMKAVDQGMQGLNIGQDKDKNIKVDCAKPELDKEQVLNMVQSQKKMTWASIASQPPKPASKPKKNNSGSGGPAPLVPGGKHIDIGTWESKNGGPKTIPPPIVSRPAWNANRGRSGSTPYSGAAAQGPAPHVQSASSAQQDAAAAQAASHPVLDELKVRNEYNPKDFDVNTKNVQFYVIKSYSEDDIHRSIKYEIWCSTEHGNKRLDQAFRSSEGKGPIYLFFSVNGSRHFCGMAQMVSPVDYSNSSNVWAQDKWKGQFKVKWIFVKDVPNAQLRHIRLENNENKPVTNSRDTQLVPIEKGKQVLKIMMSYDHKTSIFDDFVHYEKRQEEEEVHEAEVTEAEQVAVANANAPTPAASAASAKEERSGGRARGRSN